MPDGPGRPLSPRDTTTITISALFSRRAVVDREKKTRGIRVFSSARV